MPSKTENIIIPESELGWKHLSQTAESKPGILDGGATASEGVFGDIIPLSNIFSCSTDGAPSMIGCYRGFIALLKRAVPSVFPIHCTVNILRHTSQHFVAKKLRDLLNSSLLVVISGINSIKHMRSKTVFFYCFGMIMMNISNDLSFTQKSDGCQKETA